MSKNVNPDDRRTEIALARYTLILPIVRETCRRQRHQMRKNPFGFAQGRLWPPRSTTFPTASKMGSVWVPSTVGKRRIVRAASMRSSLNPAGTNHPGSSRPKRLTGPKP